MESQKILLLRHAPTQLELHIPPNQWQLSPKGFRLAQQIPTLNKFLEKSNISRIHCSNELKTMQTISPLAQKLEIDPISCPDFNEINSDQMPESDNSKFLSMKNQFFKILALDFSHNSLSSSQNKGLIALKKFKQQIKQISENFNSENILICTHGTILTLFIADRLSILYDGEKIYEIWKNLPFCAFIDNSSSHSFKKIQTIFQTPYNN